MTVSIDVMIPGDLDSAIAMIPGSPGVIIANIWSGTPLYRSVSMREADNKEQATSTGARFTISES